MPGDAGVFATVPDAMERAVAGSAWVAAMLEFESALAAAQEATAVVPTGTGAAIAAAASGLSIDVDELRRKGAAAGTPVIPLVAALSQAAGAAGAYVHHGATSQD